MLTDPPQPVAGERRLLRLALVLLTLALPVPARADDIPRTGGPYVPTPQEVVEAMLELARVGPRDFVIDLGSGDGRLVLTAAQRYGARGLGVDLDRDSFRVEDVTRAPLSEASVITLYLLPGLTELLKPRFIAELAPGSRIVSHDFDLGDWKPDRQQVMDVKEKYGAPGTWKSTLFLWTVPARVGGTWRAHAADAPGERTVLRLAQRYQRFSGTGVLRGGSLEVVDGRVEGTRVRLVLEGGARPGAIVEAAVEDDRMSGSVERDGRRRPWSAVRIAE